MTWIVVLTDDASESHASAILGGLESSVRQNSAMPAAVTTANARTALACVYLVGMADTAP